MKTYLQDLGKRSVQTLWDLVKIMLPIMILVRIADQYGFSEFLALWLEPVMGIVGLPAETGIVWAAALLSGVYGAIGAYLTLLPSMEITVAQHSILCAMILIAHAIPIEQAIVRKAGAGFLSTSFIRIGGAVLYAYLAYLFCEFTGFLSEPFEIAWAPQGLSDPSWFAWVIATIQSFALIAVIVVVLFVLIDALKAIGVIDWLNKALEPALKVMGIDKELAPLTTAGLLLGLTYGGALLIDAARRGNFSATAEGRRALFLALACLSLCHALIEDTALLFAFGADLWIILVGRMIFTICFIAVLAWVLRRPRPMRAYG